MADVASRSARDHPIVQTLVNVQIVTRYTQILKDNINANLLFFYYINIDIL